MSATTAEVGVDAEPAASLMRGNLQRIVCAIAVVQIIAIAVFGAITIQRYPLWSEVDEGAHFDNVIYVAAHGSYPILGTTPASEQELAIGQGRYPRHTTINPRTFGLGGLSYEAFQPPLYYYVAAPVSLLSSNYHTKAILLRYFGLFLLMVSVALLARLSRHVLKRQWILGLVGGLLVFLMPGVIVRMVTISDINLALPLALLTLTELWIAWERGAWRRLPLCGLLIGACLLTDLYLVELAPVYLVVALTIWRKERSARTLVAVGAGGVIAAFTVSPWLIFNEVKYHAVTATAIAKREQLAIVNPHHVHYALSQVPGLVVSNLFQPLLPQEWGSWIVGHALFSYGATLFQVLLIPVVLALAVALGRRLWTSGLLLLALPLAVNVVLCAYIDVGQQWESGSMVACSIYPTLAPLVLLGVAALVTLFSACRPLVLALGISSAFLIVLWIHLVPMIHTS
jgi:4-amino-4-deoxy-L-arabinose transferase-like glycosyltransferase